MAATTTADKADNSCWYRRCRRCRAHFDAVMLRDMRKRFTLAEILASMDQLESNLDRSTRAIESCIQHLTEIAERMRQEQSAGLRADSPKAAVGTSHKTPADARLPMRRPQSR